MHVLVIEKDARGSIENEGGNCLRFDVIRDIDNECKFVFYEVYKDMESIAIHKTMPHFQLWADFKASGGVVSQTAVKGTAILYDLWYLLEKSFLTEQDNAVLDGYVSLRTNFSWLIWINDGGLWDEMTGCIFRLNLILKSFNSVLHVL